MDHGAFNDTILSIGALARNKVNLLICQLLIPAVVGVTFINDNHAPLGKAKGSTRWHIMLASVGYGGEGGEMPPMIKTYV